MELIEEYRELIERDGAEMSGLWKWIQMLLYFISATSGYACSVLFYVLQGNCPLWAISHLVSEEELKEIHALPNSTTDTNWWKFIITEYIHDIGCTLYSVICFSSCTFGLVWLTLFFMCGTGGYALRIYPTPWRIVIPALFFNLVFAIICICVHDNLRQGLNAFNSNIRNAVFQLKNIHHIVADLSDCGIITAFMNIQYNTAYNMCDTKESLQIISVLMVWSWILGALLLILRILLIDDFRQLKVYIYEVKKK